MDRTSLAAAKAHFSEIVDAAQHRGKRTIILRHGKPAAAVVPVEVATKPAVPAKRGLSKRQIAALWAALGGGDAEGSALADLAADRGRLERR